MNKQKGYIQVYTGDGKGKTTAALGLAIRAAGHGRRTYMGQFMKGRHYGELTALKDHPFITIAQFGGDCCIRREEVTDTHVAQAREGLKRVDRAMCSGDYDIVVLDEINVAIWFGLLTVAEVLDLLDRRPPDVELVLTGRKAPEQIIARADLVSEIREIKHYYTQGVPARNGIEM